MSERFTDVESVRDGLKSVDYLADDGLASIVYLADRLEKPILVEGPAGTGKTQLAKSIAEITDSPIQLAGSQHLRRERLRHIQNTRSAEQR